MKMPENMLAQKKREVEQRKMDRPVAELEKERYFNRTTLSLKRWLQDERKTGIIAEYIRKSPLSGVINTSHSVEAVTRAYFGYGASALSIATDWEIYGGSLDDLIAARDSHIPLLRRDLIIDEYQIVESKAFGADAIWLDAAYLSAREINALSDTAKSLGLEVLLELEEEIVVEAIGESTDLVAINIGNPETSKIDLQRSVRVVEKISDTFLKIAAGYITNVENVHYLKQCGFDAFLIGEFFMRQQNPVTAFKEFTYGL